MLIEIDRRCCWIDRTQLTMNDAAILSTPEEMMKAVTGVDQRTFWHIYRTYCGPGTPIRKADNLFNLLLHYKVYPVSRTSLFTYTYKVHSRKLLQRIHEWEEYLSSVIDEMSAAWNSRFDADNRLPHMFDASVTGAVDTFPIEVQRPLDGSQREYYNGKYCRHVVKVQGVCDNRGNCYMIWYSGTHKGTISDIKLFREHTPPFVVGSNERLLGDKAYIGNPRLIAPIKKRRGQVALSRRDAAYNIIHGWYRSTIEHCFAFLKRFRILNGVYRGRISRQPEYLDRALKIIMHISCVYTPHNRQRSHPLIPGGVPSAIAAAPIPIAPPAPRIDTGVKGADLRRHMNVRVWWVNDWWYAKVVGLPVGRDVVTVKFVGQDDPVTGILPRHIEILRR